MFLKNLISKIRLNQSVLGKNNYISSQKRLFNSSITRYSTPIQDRDVIDNKIFLNDKYSSFTYNDLYVLSSNLSNQLLSSLNKTDLNGEKIAVLCSNNYTYLISILAIWMANGVPLGLNKLYPTNLIDYFIKDAKCQLVINGIGEEGDQNHDLNNLLDKNKTINFKLLENDFYVHNSASSVQCTDSLRKFKNLLTDNLDKEALILYTSGTSGLPKGVVLTNKNLARTTETIIDAWKFGTSDSLLHVLPLNHVHGLIYALLSTMYAGAHVDMLAKFNPEHVWSKLLDNSNGLTMFMAVPTIYVQLVNYYNQNEEIRKKFNEEYIRWIFKNKLRLVVSGSAPLNVKTHQEWLNLTGYQILERYGMTEIGLGLSNPYEETETKKRVPGCVGRPYGNTKVRIVEPYDSKEDEDDKHVLIESDHETDVFPYKSKNNEIFGELQIKGDMVFKEYLGKPKQTQETFSKDGWFKTGDTAVFLDDHKIYKLVGRTSVDVIKSGGYKISALDIEKVILSHPEIDDVAVMGLSDPVWGQRVFSLLVLKQNVKQFNQDEFVRWCKSNLPKYSVPTIIKVIDKMPRNQLGKVNKKELIKKYEQETQK